jgi:hypothetical protein
MLKESTLTLRQSGVIRYLRLFESASHVGWVELSEITDLAARLLLCHPLWLDAVDDHKIGLGLHGFRGGGSSRVCESHLLWGYECPLTDERIESDHLFPMSLGGPAVGTNQVWLCRVHNQWKASNLMDYPWERGEPPWLDRQISRMRELVPADGVLNR